MHRLCQKGRTPYDEGGRRNKTDWWECAKDMKSTVQEQMEKERQTWQPANLGVPGKWLLKQFVCV